MKINVTKTKITRKRSENLISNVFANKKRNSSVQNMHRKLKKM
jgi:hypothetical protein